MVPGEDLPLEPEFIDDIGAYFDSQVRPDRNVDAVLNGMREKLQHYSVAENRALTRHQNLSQQEVHLKKSLDCVLMLTQRKQADKDTVVDYALGGVFCAAALWRSCVRECVKTVCMQPTFSPRPRFHQ